MIYYPLLVTRHSSLRYFPPSSNRPLRTWTTRRSIGLASKMPYCPTEAVSKSWAAGTMRMRSLGMSSQ